MIDRFLKKIMVAAVVMAVAGGAGCFQTLSAQSPEAPTIVDHLRKSGRHVIIGSDELIDLLSPDENDGSDTEKKRSTMRTVFRVQVFSDNKGERSRDEGEKKKRAVQRRFPEYPVSLGWDSPYWKVKVGIFNSHDEAAEAAARIKKAFPSYAREVHVIRDRVRTSN